MTSLSVNPNENALKQGFQGAVRIYNEGDRLERYSHGQPIAPSDKSYSLLFFPARDLFFPAAFSARIHNHLARNNLVFIGDIVTQPFEKVVKGHSHQNLGARSKPILSTEIIEHLGLNFNLQVAGDWPPDNLEGIQEEIMREAGLEWFRPKKQLSKYLARISLDA